jgi:hypothetical protein
MQIDCRSTVDGSRNLLKRIVKLVVVRTGGIESPGATFERTGFLSSSIPVVTVTSRTVTGGASIFWVVASPTSHAERSSRAAGSEAGRFSFRSTSRAGRG